MPKAPFLGKGPKLWDNNWFYRGKNIVELCALSHLQKVSKIVVQ